jgi:endonuclease YncB( thermonuclease family)
MVISRSLGVTGLVLALGLGVALAAQQPVGPVQVVDGDTLRIGDARIRLHGIDAPELNQTCATPRGEMWHCGRWSKAHLTALVRDQQPACTDLGADRYGRMLARCTLGGVDIAEQMVADGAALAYIRYSDAYAGTQAAARAAARGMWAAGPQTAPEDHRRARAASAPVPAIAGNACQIKGNIGASGRIYHQPGQRDYAATRISAAKGEGWFCTTIEAEAAGFRAAKR